ncbi:uncharacterized protein LOC142777500 isoform X2 [Rhipicephalus microplus]|uniref:uncharacterized protein LOC142777500 isoform X2 n=1 Tax=Rhipicephalus microplus TaxID=6941 RepID=UPI003F6C33DD
MHGLWVAMSDFSLPDGFLRDSNAPFLDVYSQRVQQLLKKLAAWTRRVLGFIERSTHMTNMSGLDSSLLHFRHKKYQWISFYATAFLQFLWPSSLAMTASFG